MVPNPVELEGMTGLAHATPATNGVEADNYGNLPCRKSEHTLGKANAIVRVFTAYRFTTRCPRRAFINGLVGELQKPLQEGVNVILLLDGNESMVSGELQEALQRCSLRESIIHKHGLSLDSKEESEDFDKGEEEVVLCGGLGGDGAVVANQSWTNTPFVLVDGGLQQQGVTFQPTLQQSTEQQPQGGQSVVGHSVLQPVLPQQ